MTVVRFDRGDLDSLRIARRAMQLTLDAVEDTGGALGSRYRVAMDDLDALISRGEAELDREAGEAAAAAGLEESWARAQRAGFRCDPDESAGLADVTPLDTWSRRVSSWAGFPRPEQMEYQEMHDRERRLK